MYTYPAALDAMQKIAFGLLNAHDAAQPGPMAYVSQGGWSVTVVPDAASGTASVTWSDMPKSCIIRMPVLPASRKMTQAEFADYAGYILHEVGHPLFTSQTVWEVAVRAGQANLLNALEDVRIEKALIDNSVAANAKDVLSALVRSLDYSCGRDSFDANDSKNIGFVMGFLGRAANGYDMDASIVTGRLDPKGGVSRVLKWALPELAACRSTKDCWELAKRVIAALPSPTPKGKPGKPGEGKPGEGKPGEGKPGEGDASGQAAGGELKDSDIAPVNIRPEAKGGIATGSVKAATEATVINAVRNSARGAKVPPIFVPRNLQSTIPAAAAKATRQRALLAKALKSNDSDTFDCGLKHGRLDPRAFAKAAAGQVNVFGKRDLVEGYETDAVVLVDGSGSMSGDKIAAAATFALVVAQAASQVGVACTTYLFGASGGHGRGALLKVKEGKGKPDAAKFAAMPANTGGSTPLTHAMLQAAHEQATRAPGKRKVLFVVSDGVCNSGPSVVKKAADYVEAALGVETANLFIGDASFGSFRNEVLVNPAKDVADVGLGQFVKVLEQGRPA